MRPNLQPSSPLADLGEARKASKAAQVYDEIKEAILAGVLAPGALIDKAALCRRLGMSRFPVSVAINRLAYERLVEVEPQHGSFVSRIALRDVRECMMLRRAIEADVAAGAAETPAAAALVADLDRNLRYQQAAAQAQDTAGFYLLDVEFHRTICASLDLRHGFAILETLRDQLERIRRLNMAPPGRMADTVAEHRAVVAAISDGDRQAAHDAMRAHLAQTTAMIERFAQDHPTLFSDLP